MTARRQVLIAFAVSFLFSSVPALAAPLVVEILAMPHPPVRMALAPLRTWLAAQGSNVKVIETDVESPAGEKRLEAVGLSGHIPIVILIDNQYRHARRDGSRVDFVNFPKIPGAPAGVRGDWTIAEVQVIVGQKLRP